MGRLRGGPERVYPKIAGGVAGIGPTIFLYYTG